MRYPASEKAEIIQLVEQSHLPAKRTLDKLGIPRATFYRWYDRYREGGLEALDDRRSRPDRVWNRIPDDVRHQIIDLALEVPELSPRELAVRFTDEKKYFVSEASVYRLLKAHDLITSPAYVVIKAADEFKDNTTAINQLWQTDFTYLRSPVGDGTISRPCSTTSRATSWPGSSAPPCPPSTRLPRSTWHSPPRGLITSPSSTGHGFSQTMAHLMWRAISPSGSRPRAWSTCAGHRIILKLRERSSAGTRP
jgi:transposase-like protein